MTVLLPALVIVVLIGVNAVFVAAEFAIVGAPRAAIERRAAAGDRLAQMVHGVLSEPARQDRYVATAQLGITGASLGLGMYGEHAIAEWLYNAAHGSGSLDFLASHALATLLAVTLLTYFHIVAGEMVPKALALHDPERAAIAVTTPMRWFEFALYPFVVALNAVGSAILGLVRIRREVGAEQYYTPEELRIVVRESLAGGELAAESATVLSELFEFGDLSAGDVMVPRVNVVGLPESASDAVVLETLRANPFTRYPVFRGDLDHIVGMVHIKDFLAGQPAGAILGSVRSVPAVPETLTLDAVLAAMRRERTQLAVVLDEFGGTAGIVTLDDLFEEVIGELADSESGSVEIEEMASGHLRVAGTARLEEVGEHLGMSLEHDEVDSVSGLVLAELGRPPRPADTVLYGGVVFRVIAVAGMGVHLAEAWKETAEEQS
jgi:CBS domain containing-hemolysin-like protein